MATVDKTIIEHRRRGNTEDYGKDRLLTSPLLGLPGRNRASTDGQLRKQESGVPKKTFKEGMLQFAQSIRSLFVVKEEPQKDFWLRYLSTMELVLDLPFDKGNLDNAPRRHGGPIHFLKWSVPVPAAYQDPKGLISNWVISSIIMLCTAWGTILSRMARNPELICGFGVDASVDLAELFLPTVVPMILALETKDSMPRTAAEMYEAIVRELRKIRSVLEASNGQLDYQELLRHMGLAMYDETAHPIFQAAFVVGPPLADEGQIFRAMHVVDKGTAPLALQLRVMPPTTPGNRALMVQLLFWEDLVSASSATNLQSQLNWLFGLLVGQKEQLQVSLQEVPSISPAQEETIKKWSDHTDYAQFKPGQIHIMFLEIASRAPGQRAIIDSKDDGIEDSYTYGQMYQMCFTLAEQLRNNYRVTLDSMVPLLLERGVRMVVAIYSVLMAGGAYVPLEPHYPPARIWGILEQVEPTVALTTAQFVDLLSPTKLGAAEGAWAVLGLGAIQNGSVGPGPLASTIQIEVLLPSAGAGRAAMLKPQDEKKLKEGGGLVYVFFTSGSTGKPKGVMCEHAGLRHRVEWMHARYKMKSDEATILKHAYTFGISEWEMFWPLAVGATLVVPKPGGEKDPEYIFNLCAKHPVTVMYMVPSMLNMLLDYIQAEDKNAVDAGFNLRQVITCGEPLQEATIQQHFQLLYEAELDNLYGPTEGSMTVWRCPRGRRILQVPIGTPIDGIRVYSLAGGGQRLAEINVPGELYFAGAFIARGYLGLPGPTAQAFVPDTVLYKKYASERMYRTGDLACWKPEGLLQFLGRADNQIKLRGFRIEIGEIEAVVRTGGGVKDAVVILAGEGESKFLAAYVAPMSVDLDALRATCNAKLPHYMVPSAFLKLDRLPVTDRGKLDKKALPAAKMDGQALGTKTGALVPPRNSIEAMIVGVFSEVLGKDASTIGIESDFVSLGGNSVLAGKVTSRLRKALNLPLPGTALYKKPTPAQFAQLVQELRESLGMDSGEDGAVAGAADEDTPPPAKRWKGMSSTRCTAVLMTMVMPLLDILSQLTDLLTVFETLLIKVLFHMGFPLHGWYLIAMIGGLNFVVAPAFIVFDLLVGLLVTKIFIGKLTPGSHPVFSVTYFKWLYKQRVMESVVKGFQSYFIGTPALNAVYRLFGAKIGKGVVINTREVFIEPELITIEDGALIDTECKITCHSLGDGELMLHPVHVGRGARARSYSALGRGATLPAAYELVPTGCLVGYGGKVEGRVTGGKLGKLKPGQAAPPRQEPFLRLLVGVPILFLIDALAVVPTYIMALKLVELDWVLYLFVVSVVGEHLHRAGLVILTIVTKWCLVGKVRAGSRDREGAWTGMCHWVVEVLLERESFKEALDNFINTEVLRLVFVLLGATIGRRASMDMITCHTPDLLSIGDDMLFGSKVGIICEDEERRKPVQICRGANVLDNCVLCPGVTVGQRAILGTNTLAASGQYFPPDTINTGNKGGQAVFLRKKGKGLPSTLAMEAEAQRRMDSLRVWTLFNIGLVCMALLETVLKTVKSVPLMVALSMPVSWKVSVPVVIAFMAVEEFLEAGLLFIMKWVVIGKFKEREVVFFGLDHYLWMCWLMVSSTFNHLDGFHGTPLYSAYLRAMGAKVGRDCSLFGFTLEFDLLHIGDCANVGLDCDNTCHTVENMVLKMVPVRLGSYSTMQRHSFVMPGAELGEGAVLFEESQVLKGEVVPENEVWAGNPAEPVKVARSVLWQVQGGAEVARQGSGAKARAPSFVVDQADAVKLLAV